RLRGVCRKACEFESRPAHPSLTGAKRRLSEGCPPELSLKTERRRAKQASYGWQATSTRPRSFAAGASLSASTSSSSLSLLMSRAESKCGERGRQPERSDESNHKDRGSRLLPAR